LSQLGTSFSKENLSKIVELMQNLNAPDGSKPPHTGYGVSAPASEELKPQSTAVLPQNAPSFTDSVENRGGLGLGMNMPGNFDGSKNTGNTNIGILDNKNLIENIGGLRSGGLFSQTTQAQGGQRTGNPMGLMQEEKAGFEREGENIGNLNKDGKIDNNNFAMDLAKAILGTVSEGGGPGQHSFKRKGGKEFQSLENMAKPLNYKTAPCKLFHSPTGCTRGEFCHFIHEPVYQGNYIIKIHLFFHRPGNSQFGGLFEKKEV
jgi:hypothetical protein